MHPCVLLRCCDEAVSWFKDAHDEQSSRYGIAAISDLIAGVQVFGMNLTLTNLIINIILYRVKLGDEICLRDPEYSVILVLYIQLQLQRLSPLGGLITPVTTPFFVTPRITHLDDLISVSFTVYHFRTCQNRIAMFTNDTSLICHFHALI